MPRLFACERSMFDRQLRIVRRELVKSAVRPGV
jgi:hypothetical protein